MDTYQVGSSKVEITPPLTIPYLGYEPRHAFFQGVHDPLYVRALAIGDGREEGSTDVVILAADSLGFSNALLGPERNFTHEVRMHIHALTGIPPGHVMLASSHAHSTPETANLRRLLDTPAAGPWLETLIDQLASAAVMAFHQRRPATLKAGIGEVVGLAHNRRDRYRAVKGHAAPGPTDPQVAILLAESTSDNNMTILSNFACHPVTVQVQPYISADFPGAAMSFVENAVPYCTNSLFLQGACADQNPIRNTSDFNDVARYGWMLGGEIVKTVGRMCTPDYPVLPAVVDVQSATIELDARTLPPRAVLEQEHQEATRQLENAVDAEERAIWQRKQRLAQEALVLADFGSAPVPAEVQVIRVGDVAFVGLPGEPFVELGLSIKKRSPATHTFVVGYANDWIGYLTTPSAWEEGGYEVSLGPWTRVGPDGGYQLVDKAVELLNQLWRK